MYKQRSDVGAVIHTHSPMVSAYAMAHQPMPIHYEGLLRQGVSDDIPVAAWGPRGSRESVTNIEDALRAHPDASAVLLANHGLLAFGRDSGRAAHLIISLEEAAEMMLLAERFPSIVRVLQYEAMIADPAAALRVAAELCGVPSPASPLPTIADDRGCAMPYRQYIAAELER